VADLLYAGGTVLFLALMGAYARACEALGAPRALAEAGGAGPRGRAP
jgi:hypothetical protein